MRNSYRLPFVLLTGLVGAVVPPWLLFAVTTRGSTSDGGQMAAAYFCLYFAAPATGAMGLIAGWFLSAKTADGRARVNARRVVLWAVAVALSGAAALAAGVTLWEMSGRLSAAVSRGDAREVAWRQRVSRYQDGETAILGYALTGRRRDLERMLAKGYSPNTGHYNSETILMKAAQGDQAETAAWLLRRGARPNDKDYYGLTALHHAVQTPSPAVVKVLLDAKAAVDARDRDGSTPLMRACESDDASPEVVDLLLARGANPRARDKKGKTVLRYAEDGGNRAIIARIRGAAGGK